MNNQTIYVVNNFTLTWFFTSKKRASTKMRFDKSFVLGNIF